MELSELSLFSVIKKRLAWLGQRQEVIAQNIANADTPRYKAKDLKPLTFRDMLQPKTQPLNMVATKANHLPGERKRQSEFGAADERKPYETSADGNSVILEEQMAKLNETQVSHRLTNELYKKHLQMIRMAIGANR